MDDVMLKICPICGQRFSVEERGLDDMHCQDCWESIMSASFWQNINPVALPLSIYRKQWSESVHVLAMAVRYWWHLMKSERACLSISSDRIFLYYWLGCRRYQPITPWDDDIPF